MLHEVLPIAVDGFGDDFLHHEVSDPLRDALHSALH